MRIVVAGLFNSGSTCIAGALDRLGVDMGSPYWHDNENFYEPYDLSCILREFWNQPNCVESTRRDIRLAVYRNWIMGREALGRNCCGAKHPLLSLSLGDLQEAWGKNTLFVWSYRPLDESIRGLRKRGWFGEKTETLQETLWNSLTAFASTKQNMLKIDYNSMLENSSSEIDRIIEACGLTVNEAVRENAINSVRTPD